MRELALITVLSPLVGSIAAGLFGQQLGRTWSHRVTIAGVGVAFAASLAMYWQVVVGGAGLVLADGYTWLVTGGQRLHVGFQLDELSVTMACVVTFVSWMVHFYSIGYMHDDPGYQRFFSYISLFTFSMLMLVLADNFLQLFFGWEAVGLVSYLLIGFWYRRPSAIHANLKAFLVNRVGDFGFLLGIAGVLAWFGSLDYMAVFPQAPGLAEATVTIAGLGEVGVITLICVLLFVGAMGKSAQVPLHVWLPDSMEGPTPISALIHAATMVTAGIFMVARMSPLYELSETALSLVLVIGAITALAMGLVGIVQHDIKRVIAYSTLSQLGYMAVALGASAYAAAIFHLVTHAFFKALLFLAAGSVIIALHHEQDMRRMGGLWRHMPVTWLTALVGSLALIGFPGTSGFFSKDAIIEAVHHSELPGAGFAWACVLSGVFVTALYTFRMFFLTFHGESRIAPEHRGHVHETPLVVTGPLVALAVPSLVVGAWLVGPMLYGGYFGGAIAVAPEHDVLARLGEHFHGAASMVAHGVAALPTWLGIAGIAVAWFAYLRRPGLPERVAGAAGPLYRALVAKYGFDLLYERVLAAAGRGLGWLLWRVGDVVVIDGGLVNGTARMVRLLAGVVRRLQSGYLYDYAFAMIVGLLTLIALFVYGWGRLTP